VKHAGTGDPLSTVLAEESGALPVVRAVLVFGVVERAVAVIVRESRVRPAGKQDADCRDVSAHRRVAHRGRAVAAAGVDVGVVYVEQRCQQRGLADGQVNRLRPHGIQLCLHIGSSGYGSAHPIDVASFGGGEQIGARSGHGCRRKS
jgi:hypothetical protein